MLRAVETLDLFFLRYTKTDSLLYKKECYGYCYSSPTNSCKEADRLYSEKLCAAAVEETDNLFSGTVCDAVAGNGIG